MVHSAFYRGLEAAQRIGPLPPAERAHRAADLLHELEAIGRPAPWACRAGCAHCCSHPVGIAYGEALRLLQAIAALPDPERRRLRAAIAAAAQATAALPWLQLSRRPCPLLDGQRCAVYAARPLACRAFGSTDAEACAADARGEPTAVPFDRRAFGLGLGLGAALAAPHGHRELRAALAALLDCAPADAIAAFVAARPAGTMADDSDDPATAHGPPTAG